MHRGFVWVEFGFEWVCGPPQGAWASRPHHPQRSAAATSSPLCSIAHQNPPPPPAEKSGGHRRAATARPREAQPPQGAWASRPHHCKRSVAAISPPSAPSRPKTHRLRPQKSPAVIDAPLQPAPKRPCRLKERGRLAHIIANAAQLPLGGNFGVSDRERWLDAVHSVLPDPAKREAVAVHPLCSGHGESNRADNDCRYER